MRTTVAYGEGEGEYGDCELRDRLVTGRCYCYLDSLFLACVLWIDTIAAWICGGGTLHREETQKLRSNANAENDRPSVMAAHRVGCRCKGRTGASGEGRSGGKPRESKPGGSVREDDTIETGFLFLLDLL